MCVRANGHSTRRRTEDYLPRLSLVSECATSRIHDLSKFDGCCMMRIRNVRVIKIDDARLIWLKSEEGGC